MHTLIIGGTRFVGYLLAWRLLAGGHRVTLFNRGSLPDPFGDRVERLRGYLEKIVASFLAHPPPTPPADYNHRDLERRLAREIQ